MMWSWGVEHPMSIVLPESFEIGPPAGLEGRFCCLPVCNPAEIRSGSSIPGPEALLHNVG